LTSSPKYESLACLPIMMSEPEDRVMGASAPVKAPKSAPVKAAA